HRDEQEFAPDLQVRRLTAQVTAAYHRIAALEEQLLAQRSGSDPHHSTKSAPQHTYQDALKVAHQKPHG
ncbi:MAG: hypothetical protein F6K03_05435, partial [Kamptonema sp. SIO4C4]|nr:hypothetical protein [Kamptonema sp. SIO4C4]